MRNEFGVINKLFSGRSRGQKKLSKNQVRDVQRLKCRYSIYNLCFSVLTDNKIRCQFGATVELFKIVLWSLTLITKI